MLLSGAVCRRQKRDRVRAITKNRLSRYLKSTVTSSPPRRGRKRGLFSTPIQRSTQRLKGSAWTESSIRSESTVRACLRRAIPIRFATSSAASKPDGRVNRLRSFRALASPREHLPSFSCRGGHGASRAPRRGRSTARANRRGAILRARSRRSRRTKDRAPCPIPRGTYRSDLRKITTS